MPEQPPNFIILFADNLGYGDWGCYGSTPHRTPHTDRMAAEGMRFTGFYSTSGVCTPSRASLVTGCYPRRVGLHVSDTGGAVLRPVARKGLNPGEVTISRVLKARGYATACIGKWHLGDQLAFLPTRHGFDHYFGIPYSDDMAPGPDRPGFPPLPLMRGEEVVEAPVDRDFLTQRYTEEAIRFITENRDRPFFLYLPHAMPGSTRRPFASPAFQGRSANGPYGDSIEEMDWSTGEILAALERLGLDERTLVVTTSDNGAVRPPQAPPTLGGLGGPGAIRPPQAPPTLGGLGGPGAGSNAPLKGWGYNTSEGAMRMPCVVRWPGRVPAGTVCDEVASTMDLLPTLARLAGAELPADRPIDGHHITPLLLGEPDARSAYDEVGFFYYFMHQLQAVRAGRWKLYLPLESKVVGLSGQTESTPAALYDVRDDLGETEEVSARHPEVVARLLALAEAARADLGDLGRQGRGQRPAGWIEDPEPRVLGPG